MDEIAEKETPKTNNTEETPNKAEGEYVATLKEELKKFVKTEIKGMIEELKFSTEESESPKYDQEADRKIIKTI